MATFLSFNSITEALSRYDRRSASGPCGSILVHDPDTPVSADIAAAEVWAFGHRCSVLDERFLKALHRRMFGRMWYWAGEFRLSQHDAGVDFFLIPSELQKLIVECAYWIGEGACPLDEAAAKWYQRLMRIRLFLDGNVRHARLATDSLLTQLGQRRFTWGATTVSGSGMAGREYSSALEAADRGNIRPLVELARS